MTSKLALRPVVSDSDWHAYDDLRRRILFEARGRFGVYQSRHPDETEAGNHPMVLVVDGVVIGTVRIDLADKRAIFRLVAIAEPLQRRGHGRELMRLAEGFARARGAEEAIVNSAADATVFYQKLGYDFAPPDDAPDHPRMRKAL